MCHHGYHSSESFEDEVARTLREADDADAETAEEGPSFLTDERDTDVEVLTDGGER